MSVSATALKQLFATTDEAQFEREYVVVKELGTGNFGSVTYCISNSTKVKCAVKTFYPGGPEHEVACMNECFVAAYIETMRAGLNLNLPKVYKIQRIKQSDPSKPDVWKIVMELIEGVTLRKNSTSRNRLDTSEVQYWGLVQDLTDTLFRLEAMGITYIDLHNENVMVSHGTSSDWPSIYLIDLGLACINMSNTSIYNAYSAFRTHVDASFPEVEKLACKEIWNNDYPQRQQVPASEYGMENLLNIMLALSMSVKEETLLKLPLKFMKTRVRPIMVPAFMKAFWSAAILDKDDPTKPNDKLPALDVICREVHRSLVHAKRGGVYP